MASGKHCVFAAATGIIYYMTRSRNCGLQKISGGSWRFPPGNMPGWNTGRGVLYGSVRVIKIRAPTQPITTTVCLSSIKSTTASGHDKFTGFVLKRLAGALAPNITIIYSSTIRNNIVPSCWKMAEVRAIYKQKGSKTDPNNYRPISVLPILGRTLEKLIAAQLYNYCDEHDILPPEQLWNGFICCYRLVDEVGWQGFICRCTPCRPV